VLAAIPVASAAGEIVRGPQGVPGRSPDVIPAVDSALRYANVFKFAVGPVIWSQLRRVEQSPALTSKRPKRRYLLDIVSRAQKAIVAITPTAINDAVLAAATTSK
jgi:hypothetical protein